MTGYRTILISGPTASGKTSLAIALAKALDGVIINADSMQVYCEAPLITAQPSAEEMRQAPHYLFGYRSAENKGSVGTWLKDVSALLENDLPPDQVLIFVGGTGLYLEALFRGLATIPEIPDNIRARWSDRRAQGGSGALFRSLLEGDPESANAIGPNDPQRLQRALEVMETTNRSLISFQQENAPPLMAMDGFLGVVNNMPRAELYGRIDKRFDLILEHGAADEVKAIMAGGELARDHPLSRAIGYPQLKAHFAGESSLAEAAELAKRDSRRYAKRQLTWYRNRFSDWQWFETEDQADRVTQITAAFRAQQSKRQS